MIPFNSGFDFSYPLIAPFWTDLDPSESGALYYRSTSDSETLNHTTEIITSINSNYNTYRPTLAIVATWEMVPHYRNSTLKVNRFDTTVL